MANRLTPRVTPSRLQWLQHLRDHGPSLRAGFGRAPYYCGRFGWSDWVDISNGDFREQLTELGREILAREEADNG